ncbi:MAG: aminotransferase class IV [Chitinophagaceae bacterium]
MIAYVNTQFINEELATIGIGDMSIQRGYGLFDYFRTSNHYPLFIDDYLERFFNSAKVLRLEPLHTREEIKSIIHEMIRMNNIPDSGFRLILTGGYSPDNFEPVTPNFIVIQQPIRMPSPEKIQKGLSIILFEYQRDVPEAKSINYLMSVFLLDKMRQQQADEILYFKDNLILEFPRANVFIVTKEKTIVTPSKNVLHGITRKRILELAGNKYVTEERNVTVDELKNAAEVFLTSTTKRIIPVVKIENQKVGDGSPGEITKKLLSLFVEMEENILNKMAQTKELVT